ncbi:MAG TPA: Hsp20/alpha crystallin family protein [Burkholderiaceae bacterium]|nr:Hsp20/alpha crystallin family protein [Burkholderiaceae bacterium]
MFLFPAPIASTRRVTPTLSRAIDHLLNDGYPASEQRVPALDVVESDTAYTLSFDLPGLTKEQLKVTVQGRRVSIEAGTASTAEAKDGERVLYRERSAAQYARTVSLPAEVDQSSSSAKFENGVLTLVLTKKVPTGATQLSIN